ncbi:MAG: hypothetical protein EPO68_10305 [Planctomycetota bacterium]|nr:MAG: hypothetical protein EPO68_10305 [Planctomycetota bacterium]
MNSSARGATDRSGLEILHGDAIGYRHPDGKFSWIVEFEAVEWIAGYKVDLYAVDCICLGLGARGLEGGWFEMHEEMAGWREALAALERAFPGVEHGVYSRDVMFPAFKLCWTVLWLRPGCTPPPVQR